MADVLELTLDEAVATFATHKKIVQRLSPAVELGLGYLKLGQPSASLSGGEAQRLKLVPHLIRKHGRGSVLLLDEPTTGLHFEDVARLVRILRNLVEQGATVVAIEHSQDVIAAADWVVELGPGAARAGGRLLYAGPVPGLARSRESVIAPYLSI
jgi:excinuclease ABC subunit A